MGATERARDNANPNCLLRLHERANTLTELTGEGIEAWMEWEWEAMSWGVPLHISREELEGLLERGLRRRRGSRGGRETARRYGPRWFSLLALKRWGKIDAEALDAARTPW